MYQLYRSPSDRLKQSLAGLLPSWIRPSRSFCKEFWALREVSFELQPGEAFGVIGTNGSGKSTLLQIIAGILPPTAGEVRTSGRVAALLELGSGFHPELTGRENVYLNGATLGLSREQIGASFDAIVDFAAIGDFIDQPVKTYSSGMRVRLAFAVQASIEPDVLLIDEALSVGDLHFQHKCHVRMEGLRKRGRTALILVSHNMAAIQKYCERALLLDRGRVVFLGSSAAAVRRYYTLSRLPAPGAEAGAAGSTSAGELPSEAGEEVPGWPAPAAFSSLADADALASGWVRCLGVALCDERGQATRQFTVGQEAVFYYEYEALQELQVPYGIVLLRTPLNIVVHGKASYHDGGELPPQVRRGQRIRIRQSVSLNMTPGRYTFDLTLDMLSRDDFLALQSLSYQDYAQRFVRLHEVCLAGEFSLLPATPQGAQRAAWTHFGLCDLPGSSQLVVV